MSSVIGKEQTVAPPHVVALARDLVSFDLRARRDSAAYRFIVEILVKQDQPTDYISWLPQLATIDPAWGGEDLSSAWGRVESLIRFAELRRDLAREFRSGLERNQSEVTAEEDQRLERMELRSSVHCNRVRDFWDYLRVAVLNQKLDARTSPAVSPAD